MESVVKKDYYEFRYLLKQLMGTMNQQDFAEKVDLSRGHLNRLLNETKIARPSLKTLSTLIAKGSNDTVTLKMLLDSCEYTDEDLETCKEYVSDIRKAMPIHLQANKMLGEILAGIKGNREKLVVDDVSDIFKVLGEFVSTADTTFDFTDMEKSTSFCQNKEKVTKITSDMKNALPNLIGDECISCSAKLKNSNYDGTYKSRVIVVTFIILFYRTESGKIVITGMTCGDDAYNVIYPGYDYSLAYKDTNSGKVFANLVSKSQSEFLNPDAINFEKNIAFVPVTVCGVGYIVKCDIQTDDDFAEEFLNFLEKNRDIYAQELWGDVDLSPEERCEIIDSIFENIHSLRAHFGENDGTDCSFHNTLCTMLNYFFEKEVLDKDDAVKDFVSNHKLVYYDNKGILTDARLVKPVRPVIMVNVPYISPEMAEIIAGKLTTMIENLGLREYLKPSKVVGVKYQMIDLNHVYIK